MGITGIEFKNVSKHYPSAGGPVTALQEINLQVSPGDFVGLMGMNGSGKSTLVRLINGLIKPTSGQVYVNGMNTTEPLMLQQIRRLIGMVFQNPDNQMICPIIEEEIAFGLENLDLSLSEVNSRVEWALKFAGLEKMRFHAPHLLSGGQKQKVALVSVLAMQPDYLVLDEPASMLDPHSRIELMEQLAVLNRENGMTIILSSHDPEDLLHATRLVVLDQGKIYLQGTPREVYAKTDKLAAIGLEPPGLYQLIMQLEKAGLPVDSEINTITELVEEICR
ncbi:MAG: energy-coupling factor transporter ATPase [Clostridiales bacterium]|nr:energy-coupling factor transporter ATPase [Clostridiales bacterium]